MNIMKNWQTRRSSQSSRQQTNPNPNPNPCSSGPAALAGARRVGGGRAAHDDDMRTPTGYPHPNTAAGTAHSAHSTQPALLPPHLATPRVGDNTPADAPAPLKRSMLAPGRRVLYLACFVTVFLLSGPGVFGCLGQSPGERRF